MVKLIIILSIISIVCVSCNNSVDPNQNNCEQKIIIDPELYNNSPNDDFDFRDIKIDGDCLVVTIEYGGGCGNVEVKLIDAGVVMESNPVQRNLKVSFKDEDFCKVLLVREFSFDLTPIRTFGENRVLLNISNWNKEGVLYTY